MGTTAAFLTGSVTSFCWPTEAQTGRRAFSIIDEKYSKELHFGFGYFLPKSKIIEDRHTKHRKEVTCIGC